MLADKRKKLKVAEMVEDDDTSSDHIDAGLVISIDKLQEVQDQLEKLNEEASDEVLVVEQKYNEIRRPLYEKRSEIIKSIPDFWLTAFLSHPALSELLNEEDQKIFKYLSSLEVEEARDVKSGYSINFNFNPNPFFEDTKLTKTFTFLDDQGATKVTSTPIRWKEGAGISNGTFVGRGNKRPLNEESFFSWFSAKDMDEIAEIIKEDLWPDPLIHFNCEGDEDELQLDDDDDEGVNGEEGSEEDDEILLIFERRKVLKYSMLCRLNRPKQIQVKNPRKINKSRREKLKREQLNDLFLHLAKALGFAYLPTDIKEPQNGKASILTEAARFLNGMFVLVDRLRKENKTLTSESQYGTLEKEELEEDSTLLSSEVEKLRGEIESKMLQSQRNQIQIPCPLLVIPFSSTDPNPNHDRSLANQDSVVKKPCPRYPGQVGSWQSQILEQQLRVNNAN